MKITKNRFNLIQENHRKILNQYPFALQSYDAFPMVDLTLRFPLYFTSNNNTQKGYLNVCLNYKGIN